METSPSLPHQYPLNVMSYPLVLSAVCSGTFQEWLQIYRTTPAELLTFQGSWWLGQVCHLKPFRKALVQISGSHWELEAFSAEIVTACVPAAAEQTQMISLDK